MAEFIESISRRDILKLAVTTSFSGIAVPRALGSGQSQDTATFCYYSDSHISVVRNVKECETMLAEIGSKMRPAFAINGGDVVDYGWPGEYDNHNRLIANLGYKTHHVPGNHDVRWSPLGLKIFRDRVGPAYSTFEQAGVKFILLDSTVPLSHWGHYESAMLRWAAAELKKWGPDKPVIVATHHWVGRDKVMIDNENALLEVLKPYNVKIILTGHGHNDLLWRWDEMLCTMNKGLYQGSYQQLDIDRGRDEIRLFRRTAESKTPRLLAAIPLSLSSSKRRIWSMDQREAPAGWTLFPVGGETKEARWNAGDWKPIPEDRMIPLTGLKSGVHTLALRTTEDGPWELAEVERGIENDPLQVVWARKLTGGVMSQLKLSNGLLFVSAMDGSVQAINPVDGKIRWTQKTKDYCHSSPVIGEGLVIVGSADGTIYTYDEKSGRPRWKYETNGPVYGSAVFAKGLVMIGGGDGVLRAFNPKDGKLAWEFSLPKSDTAFVQTHGATDGERVFFGAWDKNLYCLDASTGRLIWSKPCTTSTFAFSPAIGGPIVDGDRVMVPANGNELYCYRTTNGELIWKATTTGDKFGYSSPRIKDGRLYIGCLGGKGEVRCVNVADGKEIWCAATGAEIYDSSPAIGAGYIAIGAVPGLLNVIGIEKGNILAQYQLPAGHFLSSPVCDGRSIFAATYSDYVVRFDYQGVK